MAKQTFTTGQVLSAAQVNALQANDYNTTVSTKTASYVLVAADVGTTIVQNVATANTVTVNTGLFAAGDTLRIQNIGAGIATVTAGTATVNTANSLALPQWGSGILYFTSASAAIFFPSAGAAAAAASGLTKIFATTFSNVANTGTTFDAMFTSTYDNYMVVFNNMRALTNSSNLLFQLRNAASTQATAYYGNSTVGSTVTSTTNATSFNIGVGFSDATQENSYTFIVFRNTNRLSWSFQGMTRNGNGGVVGGGFSDNITANGSDGFILSASAGNITGKATIYGLAL